MHRSRRRPPQRFAEDTVSGKSRTPCAEADLTTCSTATCRDNPADPSDPVCCLCRLGSVRCTDAADQAFCTDRTLCPQAQAPGCLACCDGSLPVASLRDEADDFFAALGSESGDAILSQFLENGDTFGVSANAAPVP